MTRMLLQTSIQQPADESFARDWKMSIGKDVAPSRDARSDDGWSLWPLVRRFGAGVRHALEDSQRRKATRVICRYRALVAKPRPAGDMALYSGPASGVDAP
jgi:hypothetical protein